MGSDDPEEDEAMDRRQHVKIGLFGIGLAAYWPQFEGLQAAIEGHLVTIGDRLEAWGEVVSGGLVDTAQAGAKAGDHFAFERIDLLVCWAGTYATSTQVLPVAQRAGVPVLLLNLQPEVALDYEKADTWTCLANAGICPIPELAGVFGRAGVPYRIVTGYLHDDAVAWGEIEAWCRAAAAVKPLRRGRFGMIGTTLARCATSRSRASVPRPRRLRPGDRSHAAIVGRAGGMPVRPVPSAWLIDALVAVVAVGGADRRRGDRGAPSAGLRAAGHHERR
jgi:L-arabinose isomerase